MNAYGTIRHQDALIAYDDKVLARDDQGELMTIWDGESMKLHPITGEEVPDESKRKELYRYIKPRRADWPKAEFIVGNPPFIAGRDMRSELGDGYAKACWTVRPDIPGGADFVMHFWDEAARLLTARPSKRKDNPLRRFGFITTNSITQTFSRRVVERWLNEKEPLSMVFAIPNHPWMKASDKAAVRIAMTVSAPGLHDGILAEVLSEADLNSDTPKVELRRNEGKITGKIGIGADISKLVELRANEDLGHKGFMPYGKAFFISSSQAKAFGLDRVEDAVKYIRPYMNGRNLNNRWQGRHSLDFHDKSEAFVRDNFPDAYQHLLINSKPIRAENKVPYRQKYWWRYGQPSTQMRSALEGLQRYIGTTETATHRIFSFLDQSIAPDQKVRVIASPTNADLGILSSRIHALFSIWTGGWQGAGNDPVYQHTNTFDPFPFPLDPPETLSTLGERLDSFRKQRLAAHAHLTMTGLYNVLERVRELDNGAAVAPLSAAEKDIYDAGQIAILKELHDDIDRAVFAAYGWDDLTKALVGKPGATTPSPHKSEGQDAAEEELLMRLVALNQARAADEKRGIVHWLRPDFQIPRLGHKVQGLEQHEADLGETVLAAEAAPWPADGLDQIRALRDLLVRAEGPTPVPTLSAAFKGRNTSKRRDRIEAVLETLVATGAARSGEGGYFLPR